MRFESTCVMRFSSVFMVMISGILGVSSLTLSGHLNLKTCMIPLHISLMMTGALRMAISPASTLDRSRISLMRLNRRALLLSIISKKRIRSSGSSVSAMMREKPSMAFNGVRISWLMLARKSDFISLAFWALAEISSYSISLSIARSRSS